MAAKKGMGWNAANADIQKKEGLSKQSADKILGATNAKASPQAKASNPNLMNKPGSKGKGKGK